MEQVGKIVPESEPSPAARTPEPGLDPERRLRRAIVLTELRELNAAEADAAHVLEQFPEHLEALSLYAKIKHMRGELSLAVACAAQLHARSVPGEVARTHLESMLHLAQDPERGAGEFLAVGQFQLLQKPTAYLALEEVFQHYVNRRPNEARRLASQVASRYRQADPEVYKLAVLAEAWISEMIGDLQSACEALERLGYERGYETDLDRIMALVALYERIGTPEKLDAAVNICRYLESRYETSPVLGRLAILHQRLGRAELAAEYETRHLVAYRRSMHRPTLADVLEVASSDYLPLMRLRALELPAERVPETSLPRARAIALAIEGDLESARLLLEGSSELLDRKYLAEIADLQIGAERAIPRYVEVFREDPADLHVLERLLDLERMHHSRPIAELFRSPALASSALGALEAAVQANPGDPRIWWRLSTFFSLRPGGREQQVQFAERAAAVERAATSARTMGRALSAATYRFVGKVQGLIHEVWAGREMAPPGRGGALRKEDILGNLTDEMKDNVRNTFVAVREFAHAKFPHVTRDLLDYNYSYKVTKEDEPSGGTSAGLPTALAFLSVFLQRPLLRGFASTGVIVADAHDVLVVRPVGDVVHKVEAAYHRNLRHILIPFANKAQVEQSGIVPRPIVSDMVRYVSSLDEVWMIAFGEEPLL